MALNLSPEQGVKLTKKDRVHVAKKIKQGWKATCLIPDYGFDENTDEKKGAKKVLTAAALTYVAALAASILQLLRLIILAGGRNRD